MGYFDYAAGPPRLLADALLIGSFQSLALRPAVPRMSWIAVTFAALALALVVGVIVALVVGTLVAPLERTFHDAYVVVVYVLAAAAGGLVASAVQSPMLRDHPCKGPWLIGNLVGAPLAFPALAISLFAPENLSTVLPLWLIGLVGGIGYGVASGIGLVRSVAHSSM